MHDHGSRLGTQLGNRAAPVDVGSRWQEGPVCGGRPVGHGAFGAGRLIPLKAQRRSQDGVELQQQQEGQDQTHTVL